MIRACIGTLCGWWKRPAAALAIPQRKRRQKFEPDSFSMISVHIHNAAALIGKHTALWWMPRAGSLHAPAVDSLMRTSGLALLALCVLAQVAIVAGMLLRRRARAGFAVPLQWLAIGMVTALFVWMTATAEHLWSTMRLTQAQPDAFQVEVTGVQFQWYFRYPGGDGVYGATKPGLIDAAGGNPLGVDSADARGHDDVVSSVLVLPVDRQVDLRLSAQDVIHGFFVPGMRIKQNATPSMTTHLQFTPTATGDYPIVCSQLCGLGHYRMHAVMRIVSAQQFAVWMAQHERAAAASAERPGE